MRGWKTGLLALAIMAVGTPVALSAEPVPGLPEAYRAYLQDNRPASEYLAPPAASGSLRGAYDEGTLSATTTRQDDPLFLLGKEDAGKGALGHFGCALGTDLTGHSPALVIMLSRLRTDVLNRTRQAGGPGRSLDATLKAASCAATDVKAINPDAPSVQAAWGWMLGLLFSEMAPEKTSAVMKRARVFGAGAATCGVSTPSAVRDGRDVASVLYAELQASPEFRRDFLAAKAEVVAQLVQGQPAAACERETAVLARATD